MGELFTILRGPYVGAKGFSPALFAGSVTYSYRSKNRGSNALDPYNSLFESSDEYSLSVGCSQTIGAGRTGWQFSGIIIVLQPVPPFNLGDEVEVGDSAELSPFFIGDRLAAALVL